MAHSRHNRALKGPKGPFESKVGEKLLVSIFGRSALDQGPHHGKFHSYRQSSGCVADLTYVGIHSRQLNVKIDTILESICIDK